MMNVAVAMLLGSPAADAETLTARQARLWSASATAAGAGLAVLSAPLDSTGVALLGATGTLVGPSAGHLRAGDWQRGALGIGLRAAAVGGIAASGIAVTEYCFTPPNSTPPEFTWWEGPPCGDSGPEKLLGWGSVGLLGGSMVFDLWDAGRAPQRVARRQASAVLSVTPAGLHLAGTF